jgi:riboflavin biosynthesis pyrimidine reductase
MSRADEVSKRLTRLHGEDPASVRGVLHVAATWRAPDRTLHVIKIGPDSPRSDNDWFVLRTARMRADALLTTGTILRDEPDVRHDERDETLLTWRRNRVGRSGRPRSVVLTSGRGLDLGHPLLRTAHRPLIVTSESGAAALERAALMSEPPVELAARRAPGIRDTLGLLRERGCESILIEAGPTTAQALYDAPVLVDELLLSVFEAPTLADELVGPALLAPDRLETLFAHRSDPVVIDEPSGPWSFSRWVRR